MRPTIIHTGAVWLVRNRCCFEKLSPLKASVTGYRGGKPALRHIGGQPGCLSPFFSTASPEEQLRGWPKLSVHLKIDALELRMDFVYSTMLSQGWEASRLKDRSGMCWSGWDPKCTDHDQQPCLTHRREFHRCSTLGFSGFGRVGAGINGSMFERDAADETKQMIAEGHAAILKAVVRCQARSVPMPKRRWSDTAMTQPAMPLRSSGKASSAGC